MPASKRGDGARHQARPRRRDPRRRDRAGDADGARRLRRDRGHRAQGCARASSSSASSPTATRRCSTTSGDASVIEPGQPLPGGPRAPPPRGRAVAAALRRARGGGARRGWRAAERELLWAACMLHDIGTAVDYDDHHKHSRYLILNAGLPGYTPRELELIALIARYHRKGEPGRLASSARSRGRGDDERLALLSGVIRLAEQLERSRDGSVESAHALERERRAGDPGHEAPASDARWRSGRRGATPTCWSGRSARRSRSSERGRRAGAKRSAPQLRPRRAPLRAGRGGPRGSPARSRRRSWRRNSTVSSSPTNSAIVLMPRPCATCDHRLRPSSWSVRLPARSG